MIEGVGAALEAVEAMMAEVRDWGCIDADDYGTHYDDAATKELARLEPIREVLWQMSILEKTFAATEGQYQFVIKNPDGQWKFYDYDEHTGLGRYVCLGLGDFESKYELAADVLAEIIEMENLTTP